jgi:hypothetical protein
MIEREHREIGELRRDVAAIRALLTARRLPTNGHAKEAEADAPPKGTGKICLLRLESLDSRTGAYGVHGPRIGGRTRQ